LPAWAVAQSKGSRREGPGGLSKEVGAVTPRRLIRVAVRGVLAAAAACLATSQECNAGEAKQADAIKPAATSPFGSGAERGNTTTGKVVSTAAASVKVSSDKRDFTFYAAKSAKDVLAIIAQLAPPDTVTITWTQEEGKKSIQKKGGRKSIQKIEGRGTVEGLVIARTDFGVAVRSENGALQRALFPWTGKTPEEVAKLDKSIVDRVNRAKMGDQIRLTWEISDAKRVADVEYLGTAPSPKPSANAGPRNRDSRARSAAGLLMRAGNTGRPAGGTGGSGSAGSGGAF